MRTYEKIETVFERDISDSKKLIPNKWRSQTVQYLAYNYWEWTEKIDGTNIRVHWDGHKVEFGGRTERSSIPAPLVNRLNDLFAGETNEQIFEQMFGEREVILFGEGYGNKIQGVGSQYLPDSVDFILFDVLIGDNYQSRIDVESTARAFGVRYAPVVLSGDIYDAIQFVKEKPRSTIGNAPMEGLVGRPAMELKDRCGNRVIVKVKVKDFEGVDV